VGAPLAAHLTRHLPQRAAAAVVALAVFVLGASGLHTTLR